MNLLRSLLFVPGNRPDMLDKAARHRPDAFVPDLEDSVTESEKVNARCVVAERLDALVALGVPVIPRVNSLESGLAAGDLDAVLRPGVFGVSIGKFGTTEQALEVCALIADRESAMRLPPGTFRLVPWIETALAIVNAYAICTCSGRIAAVAFGAEDFTHDMGIERTSDGVEVDYARNALAVAARAGNVPALDTPYFAFKDDDGLRRSALEAKRIGFKGKFAIHPAQIDTINASFLPGPSEIEHARRVVAAFEEAEREGRGATSLDGQVVDVPVVKRARAVLEVVGNAVEETKQE